MKSFLTAMQEGRLIELPDNDKDKSLAYLGTIIEAIPEVPPGTDICGMVLQHEKEQNTAVGQGAACPHVRVAGHGELQCAVGWSPKGIDYGASDGKPVHLVIMYCIPEGERTAYLKEVSMIVRALQRSNIATEMPQLTDLNTVRDRLLDLVDQSLDLAIPEARARMIQLEVKHAVVNAAQAQPTPFEIIPVSVILLESGNVVALSQNRESVKAIEAAPRLAETIREMKQMDVGPFRLIPRSVSTFELGRVVCDCLMVKR